MDAEEPRGRGRPCLYTDAIADKIAAEVEKGLPLEFAFSLAGISRRTGWYWLEQARNGDEKFAYLLQTIERAEAKASASLLEEVRHASGAKEADPWTSRAWVLERRWPRLFGRTVQEVEHTGTVQVIRAELPTVNEDDPEVRRRLMRERAGLPPESD